jgi:hypothetical protein
MASGFLPHESYTTDTANPVHFLADMFAASQELNSLCIDVVGLPGIGAKTPLEHLATSDQGSRGGRLLHTVLRCRMGAALDEVDLGFGFLLGGENILSISREGNVVLLSSCLLGEVVGVGSDVAGDMRYLVAAFGGIMAAAEQ